MEKDDDFTDWLIAREECIMDLDDEELKATRKLNGVAKESNIEITKDALKLIAVLSEGAMRDALSILERCLQDGETNIDENKIKDLS